MYLVTINKLIVNQILRQILPHANTINVNLISRNISKNILVKISE